MCYALFFVAMVLLVYWTVSYSISVVFIIRCGVITTSNFKRSLQFLLLVSWYFIFQIRCSMVCCPLLFIYWIASYISVVVCCGVAKSTQRRKDNKSWS